jgi:hypothetical protein
MRLDAEILACIQAVLGLSNTGISLPQNLDNRCPAPLELDCQRTPDKEKNKFYKINDFRVYWVVLIKVPSGTCLLTG